MALLPVSTRRLVHWHCFSAKASSLTEMPNPKLRPQNDAIAGGINGVITPSVIPGGSNAYACLLQACTNMKTLMQAHAHILKNGLDQNACLQAKLVDMYALFGRLENARLVFDKMYIPDVILWNSMIRGYARNGLCEETLELYYQMQGTGIQGNNFTFPFVLKACASLLALQDGKGIHYHIVKGGFESDVFVGTALVDMYAKCASLEDARQVFDKISQRNVASWNAMIAGYAQNGRAKESLSLFRQMQVEGVKPDYVTIVSALPACASLEILPEGKEIHNYIIRNGFDSLVFVGTSLVDMYVKCGSINDGREVFDKMSRRDVVSWNAMIAGYAQNGHANEALALFHQMQLSEVMPNSVTMVSVLPACAHLSALQQGKWIHDYIIRNGFESEVPVSTALIDMYVKCGRIELARRLFDKISKKDVVSWNAMISGYGMHGYGKDALDLFAQMQRTGTGPDHITFIGVLSACNHAGLFDEGLQYFDCMIRGHHIRPGVEHYACIVDLLGRRGCLDAALDFIETMAVEPDAGVWGTLLGACRIHRNIEIAERVSKHLFELEPKNTGNYVLLSNIYAAVGRWDGVANVRTMLKERGLKKSPGCSWIEIKNRVHTFLVGDQSHPQSDEIYAMLDGLAGQMKEAGHVPDTSFVLHDVEEEEKEYVICTHSEKLAIAFGLINTTPGTPIQITKNLRVCGDCHSTIKCISKIVRREIVVRDPNRFHHFKGGFCSCGDYW